MGTVSNIERASINLNLQIESNEFIIHWVSNIWQLFTDLIFCKLKNTFLTTGKTSVSFASRISGESAVLQNKIEIVYP